MDIKTLTPDARDSKRVSFNAQEREEILAAYDESGQSQAEFARGYGINYQTFCGWLQKRRNQSREGIGSKTTPPFVEVESETETQIERSGVVSSWLWAMGN